MNEVVERRSDLPAKLDELSKFVLIGREKLIAVRAEIRAIDKVGLATEVRQQKLREAQDISEAVLDAEVRIGELMRQVPKAVNQYKSASGNSITSIKQTECDSSARVTADPSINSVKKTDPQPSVKADPMLKATNVQTCHTNTTQTHNTPSTNSMEMTGSHPLSTDVPKSKEQRIGEMMGMTKPEDKEKVRNMIKRFETLAAHPEIVAQAKAEARENNDIVSRSLVLNMVKEKKRAEREAVREEERQENAVKVEKLATPLDAQGLFQTIVIDPPWDWGDEGDVNQFGRAKPDYHTMPIEEIAKLPVGRIADENCHLYLWVTNRSLPKAFGLMEAWGFRYVTCLTWVKPSYGMGNYFRGSTEQVLFGVKGSQMLKRHDVGTHFEAPRGKMHSEKPEAFYKLVESCSYGPYIDIFGRNEREGWAVWGENG